MRRRTAGPLQRRKRRQNRWRRNSRRPRPTFVGTSTTMMASNFQPSGFTFQKVLRVLTATLPFLNQQKSLLGIFNLAFNLYKIVAEQKSYYPGAYSSFKITPGSLVKQSPLAASDGSKTSYPGHPVSIKFITIICHATQAFMSNAGKWTAVFIPYLELHDDTHYAEKIERLMFEEIASMPHAVTAPTMCDLRISYRMRDKTAYCARPRELKEAIGIVVIAWDNAARDDPSTAPTNSSFNCEVQLTAGFQPHVIFGPQHRIQYDNSIFEPIPLTDGKSNLCIYSDGRRQVEEIDWAEIKLSQMELE